MSIPNHPYRPLIEQVCAEVGAVPPNVLEAMVWVESQFVPSAQSKSDALGLGQIIYRWHGVLTDRTATELGKQPGRLALFDPDVNLRVSAKYLKWCYSECKTWEGAVRKYHSGACAPPPDFKDGQGTSSDQHITKFRSALHDVEVERSGSPGDATMQTIPIRQKIAPPGNANRPGTLLNDTGDLYVLVHETGNTRPGANALMHANFVYNGGGESNVSFHFTVDEHGAYQMLPLNEIGYHASDGCDTRSADWGCFSSVAIETCVHDGNQHKEAIRKNLITLIAMIITGHHTINYGGTNPRRFAVSRIRTHNDSAYDKKWCPTYMLNDKYVPKIPGLVSTLLAVAPLPPTPPPPVSVLTYPSPLNKARAERLFGKATGSDGKAYAFNESGSVSKLWLEQGKKSGEFPALVEVWTDKESETAFKKFFEFSNGWVVWHDEKGGVKPIATEVPA